MCEKVSFPMHSHKCIPSVSACQQIWLWDLSLKLTRWLKYAPNRLTILSRATTLWLLPPVVGICVGSKHTLNSATTTSSSRHFLGTCCRCNTISSTCYLLKRTLCCWVHPSLTTLANVQDTRKQPPMVQIGEGILQFTSCYINTSAFTSEPNQLVFPVYNTRMTNSLLEALKQTFSSATLRTSNRLICCEHASCHLSHMDQNTGQEKAHSLHCLRLCCHQLAG